MGEPGRGADGAAALASRLAEVPGLELSREAPLAPLTTLRIGGPAELLATVHTQRALVTLLRLTHAEGVPLALLGMGSNVLYPDEGVRGVVVRLAGVFARTRLIGTRLRAGGAVALPRIARSTAARGLSGLEAFSGFPSSVGGAVLMNAGCYGVEIGDALVSVTGISPEGRRRRYRVEDLAPSYRRTALQGTGVVVASATFRLEPADPVRTLARIEELNRKRWSSLPSGLPSAGSIFRNPEGDYAGRLIEAAGLKGATSGGAQISARHANVIVNLGGARADDVLDLMLAAREAVRSRFGVTLEPELVLEGSLRRRWRSV